MKNFSKDLREHASKIINYENKNNSNNTRRKNISQ